MLGLASSLLAPAPCLAAEPAAQLAPAPPEQSVTQEPAPAEPSGDDDPRGAYLERVAWVGFGVGMAGLATWAITGGIAAAEKSSLDDDCPDGICAAERTDDLEEAQTLADVATIGMVATIAGALWCTISWLVQAGLSDDEAESGAAQLSLRPALGPGYAGLRGEF